MHDESALRRMAQAYLNVVRPGACLDDLTPADLMPLLLGSGFHEWCEHFPDRPLHERMLRETETADENGFFHQTALAFLRWGKGGRTVMLSDAESGQTTIIRFDHGGGRGREA